MKISVIHWIVALPLAALLLAGTLLLAVSALPDKPPVTGLATAIALRSAVPQAAAPTSAADDGVPATVTGPVPVEQLKSAPPQPQEEQPQSPGLATLKPKRRPRPVPQPNRKPESEPTRELPPDSQRSQPESRRDSLREPAQKSMPESMPDTSPARPPESTSKIPAKKQPVTVPDNESTSMRKTREPTRQPVFEPDSQPPSDPQAELAIASAQPHAQPVPVEPAPTMQPLSSTQRAAYEAKLLAQLNASKRYPQRARQSHIEGVVTVTFEFTETGQVMSRKIANSSGTAILDEAALAMIDRASPLPVPPAGYGQPPFSFSVPVGFEIR